MEAEDATQEAFIRVFTKIESYNAQWKFRTWLYRIVTNVSIDRLRKKRPDYSLDAEMSGTEGLTLYSQLESKDQLPEDQVIDSEQRQDVGEAIAGLQVGQRRQQRREEFRRCDGVDTRDGGIGFAQPAVPSS
jgi:RNA polymerase sigma-70 factor (ECF subfamily)